MRPGRSWLNGGAAVLAVVCSTAVARVGPPATRPAEAVATVAVAPRAAFRRIASGSTVADQLLLEMAEPERIVALTGLGARTSPRRHLYGGRARIERLDDLESLLALRADLVLVNSYGEASRVERLREAGVAVVDLGEMRGLVTLEANIRAVAELLGDPSRGERMLAALRRRAAAVTAGLGPVARCRGLYLAAYGGSLFGGTTGSSYHDILQVAGLVDVAAEGYRGWPAFAAEEVLMLDPDVIVTKPGMAEVLCRAPGLGRLRACAAGGRIVEVDGSVLDDPGLLLVDAAERVFDGVYGMAPTLACRQGEMR